MLQIGDWVTQYRKGFWKIIDIKPKYAEEDCFSEVANKQCKKGDLIGNWVIMKKGFTPQMKFRIDSDVADSMWCKPVSHNILNSINEYFEKNPKDYQRFMDTPFIDHPAIATTWLQLTKEQVDAFQNAIKQLPDLFTKDETMELFEKYNLKQCFSHPPSNYTFVCEHSLWQLDENFNPLFKNPRLET